MKLATIALTLFIPLISSAGPVELACEILFKTNLNESFLLESEIMQMRLEKLAHDRKIKEYYKELNSEITKNVEISKYIKDYKNKKDIAPKLFKKGFIELATKALTENEKSKIEKIVKGRVNSKGIETRNLSIRWEYDLSTILNAYNFNSDGSITISDNLGFSFTKKYKNSKKPNDAEGFRDVVSTYNINNKKLQMKINKKTPQRTIIGAVLSEQTKQDNKLLEENEVYPLSGKEAGKIRRLSELRKSMEKGCKDDKLQNKDSTYDSLTGKTDNNSNTTGPKSKKQDKATKN
jgi:hypothetical protein